MNNTIASNITVDPNSPMFSVSMSMFQSLDSVNKEQFSQMDANNGTSNGILNEYTNSRLHAIESPTIHSRRPSKESIASDFGSTSEHIHSTVAAMATRDGVGVGSRPADGAVGTNSRQPSPQIEGIGARTGAGVLSATSSPAPALQQGTSVDVIGGNNNMVADDELSYSHSSSVSGRGRGRYDDSSLRDSAEGVVSVSVGGGGYGDRDRDGDIGTTGKWTKTTSTISTTDSIEADDKAYAPTPAANPTTGGVREKSAKSYQRSPDDHNDDDEDGKDDEDEESIDYKRGVPKSQLNSHRYSSPLTFGADSKSITQSASLSALPSGADSKHTPRNGHYDSHSSDVVNSFDNSGFVSNVTADDFGSTAGTGTAESIDFDNTFDNSESSIIVSDAKQDVRGGGGSVDMTTSRPNTTTATATGRQMENNNHENQKAADAKSEVPRSTYKASYHQDEDEEDDSDDDGVMEFTPQKPRSMQAASSGLDHRDRDRGHGRTPPSNNNNNSILSKQSALTSSPFDHMRDRDRDDDTHSLALSDSGALDGDVMDFSQSMDSR